MTLLKWVLVIVGVLFLAAAAAMIGVLYWASSVPSVHVTEADLAIGGSYPPEEKQALLDACNGRNIQKRPDSCTCIADKAGTELSRFLRLILTATFEGSATKIVAVTKGLMDSGVPQEKADAMEKESEQRFDALMRACGLGQ
ncbi:MAG: hypothetical protein K8F92_14955 [Hyphomicrobium sp.]|uniref:hypothetical protein n=1 Tax=Hyphomicrobium sp. TaxID=82 RepID=UPI001325AD36|nr:hypothetical protein [Hyphomicrobium sp.]KAB2941042.1 MAG: hypothetical protein F9K20_10780 [Hyphomicrobium sp.]MBZ0210931.1 hypothetical protein [Hyphomicrobium sp.]